MSIHKIRIEFIVLTLTNKKLFLGWALEGFRFRKLPPGKSAAKAGMKVA
jgi:hypothetical protein